jgi:hypothetical protein
MRHGKSGRNPPRPGRKLGRRRNADRKEWARVDRLIARACRICIMEGWTQLQVFKTVASAASARGGPLEAVDREPIRPAGAKRICERVEQARAERRGYAFGYTTLRMSGKVAFSMRQWKKESLISRRPVSKLSDRVVELLKPGPYRTSRAAPELTMNALKELRQGPMSDGMRRQIDAEIAERSVPPKIGRPKKK